MKENLIQGYIYKITNLQNNFSYIGKTTYKDINRRFQQHKYYALVRQLVDRIVSKTIICKFESYLKYKIIYEQGLAPYRHRGRFATPERM